MPVRGLFLPRRQGLHSFERLNGLLLTLGLTETPTPLNPFRGKGEYEIPRNRALCSAANRTTIKILRPAHSH